MTYGKDTLTPSRFQTKICDFPDPKFRPEKMWSPPFGHYRDHTLSNVPNYPELTSLSWPGTNMNKGQLNTRLLNHTLFQTKRASYFYLASLKVYCLICIIFFENCQNGLKKTTDLPATIRPNAWPANKTFPVQSTCDTNTTLLPLYSRWYRRTNTI